MLAVTSSKTSVNIYQITRRNIPENSHIHTRRRQNPKSHQPTCQTDLNSNKNNAIGLNQSVLHRCFPLTRPAEVSAVAFTIARTHNQQTNGAANQSTMNNLIRGNQEPLYENSNAHVNA
jgi:hypothetical protein